MNEISPQKLKHYFKYIIDKKLIGKVEPDFFQSYKPIQYIYNSIYDHYLKTDNIVSLTPEAIMTIDSNLVHIKVKNKVIKNKITFKELELLLNRDEYDNVDKVWVKEQLEEDFKKYKADRNLLEQQLLLREKGVDVYIERNNVDISLENTSVLIGDDGTINYSSMSYEETKKFINDVSKKKSKDVIKYIVSDARTSNVETSEYIFFPFIYERQSTIIFGRPGQGKSIAAMEMANFIAMGKCDWEYFRVDTPPQKVLFLDFENGVDSFNKRYKRNNKDKFDKNLIVKNIDMSIFNAHIFNKDINIKYSKIFDFIAELLIEHDSKVVFIDTLSVIAPETERSEYAQQFMNICNALKQSQEISIFFVGHTPKVQEFTTLDMNQLRGSSVFSNNINVMLGFQKSRIEDISYMKVLKFRDTVQSVSEKVYSFKFENTDESGFSLEYVGTEDENDLIDNRKNNSGVVKYDKSIKLDILYDMVENKLSYSKLMEKYNISSKGTIAKIKNDYLKNVDNLKDEYVKKAR